MFLDLKHAYFGLCVPFMLIWALFFLLSPQTRKDQLRFSILKIPFGPAVDILYFTDYWNPESILFVQIGDCKIMLESVLFAFFFGGIASVAYRAFFQREACASRSLKKERLLLHYGTFFAVTATLITLGINSIFATAIGYGCSGLTMVLRGESSFLGALFTSVFVTMMLFSVYLAGRGLIFNSEIILQNWWLLYSTNLDLRIVDIPLTEMIWAICYGFTAGARYNPTPNTLQVGYLTA